MRADVCAVVAAAAVVVALLCGPGALAASPERRWSFRQPRPFPVINGLSLCASQSVGVCRCVSVCVGVSVWVCRCVCLT